MTSLMPMNRVLVLGCSGSGKTTLTRKLAARIGADPIYLDQHHWQRGWVVPPRDQWHETLRSLIARERWVMDGTYDGTLHLRLPRADAIILFETNRLRCLWRVTARWLAGQPRPELPEECPDKVDWEFVRYIWTFDRVVLPKIFAVINKAGRDVPIVRLSGIEDAERWLQTVPVREGIA